LFTETDAFTEEPTFSEPEDDSIFIAIAALVAITLAIVLIILGVNCLRKTSVKTACSEPPETDEEVE
jgi:hypothetical protein